MRTEVKTYSIRLYPSCKGQGVIYFRDLAERGMSRRAFTREAERLEAQAEAINA